MSGEARNIRRNRSTVSARVHCLPSLCFILHHFHSLISFASHLLSHGIIFPHFISNQFFPFSFCLPFNSLECACFNPFRLFIFAFTFFHAFVIVFLFHIPFHEKKSAIRLPLPLSHFCVRWPLNMVSLVFRASIWRNFLKRTYVIKV